MADELDNNPLVLAMSPEAQKLFKQELVKFSPEDQATIRQHLNASAPQSTYEKFSNPQPVSPTIQKMAEQVNLPSRIGRGAGIAIGGASEASGISPMNVFPSNPVSSEQIQQLIHAAKNPKQTLKQIADAAMRGYQASQPGQTPSSSDESYSRIGEAAGNVAALAGSGAAANSLSGLANIAANSALAGGTTALTQAQGGNIKVLPNLKDTEQSISNFASNPSLGTASDMLPNSIMGNAAAPIVAKAGEVGMTSVAKAFPKIASFLTKRPEEAFESVVNDPAFLEKHSGTLAAIESKKQAVVDEFDKVSDTLKHNFDVLKKQYGVKYIEGQARPISDIESDFNALQKNSAPTIKKTIQSPIVDEKGVPISREIEVKGASKQERLQKLLNLDRDINATTGGRMDDISFDLKKKIQSAISDLPGGKRLQYVRGQYEDFMNIKNALGDDMADPLRAPTILEKIVKGDINGALSGSQAKKLAAVKMLEQHGDGNILQPLRNEMLARELNSITSGYSPRGVIGKAIAFKDPVLGAAEYATSSPAFLAKVAKGIGTVNNFQRAIPPSAGIASVALSRLAAARKAARK